MKAKDVKRLFYATWSGIWFLAFFFTGRLQTAIETDETLTIALWVFVGMFASTQIGRLGQP